MTKFPENFYGVLFTPSKTFDELKENPPLLESFAIVVFISVLNSILNPYDNVFFQGLSVINSAFGGLISWVFFALFLEILASIFKRGGRIKIFLCLSAYALLPWIFSAPINLFKTGGFLFESMSVLLGLAVWLWTAILTALAVMKTYEISAARIVIFLLIPTLGSILGFYWFFGFFATLFGIMK